MTAIYGPFGVSDLTVSINGIPRSTGLKDLEIRQVCSTPNSRLVVFGFDWGYTVTILDEPTGDTIHSFLVYDPIMSPDRSWLAMRVFHHPRSEVLQSDAYLLYDLVGGEDATAPNGQTLYGDAARGRVMYPILAGSKPFNLADIPELDNHNFRSESFYWSSDSRSVVFADSAHDSLSVVLVRIADGKIPAYVHPVSASEVCTEASAANLGTSGLTLSQAQVNAIPGAPLEITVVFKSGTPGCTPRELRLTQADFEPAKTEVYQPIPRKKPIGIDARERKKQ